MKQGYWSGCSIVVAGALVGFQVDSANSEFVYYDVCCHWSAH